MPSLIFRKSHCGQKRVRATSPEDEKGCAFVGCLAGCLARILRGPQDLIDQLSFSVYSSTFMVYEEPKNAVWYQTAVGYE